MQYSCKELNNQITFYPDAIDSCCSGFLSPRFYTINDNNINYDSLVYTKNKFAEDFKHGNILQSCKNCPHLQKYDENLQFNKFTKILVNHFTCCNCACVYCVRDSYLTKEQKQSKQKYELLPIIKEMYKRKLISEEKIDVEFQGGDIGCLSEFSDLITLFLEKSNVFFRISTNNIVYHPIIKKLLDENRVELSVAIDCGTRSTYKKIKGVDKFDLVVKNLERYIQNSENVYNLIAKYIIVNKYNDNKKEILSFINLIEKLKINSIVISFDYKDIMSLKPSDKKHFVLPKHYYDLVNFFTDETKKRHIQLCMDGYSKSIYDKGFFEKK